ncbi:MAG TPA: LysR family transcriptional regulator [Xanthobacteraceae bacterium]|jgi:DNA-binding transcriptional LysR family regulator
MAKGLDWDARIGSRVRLRDLHILLAVVQCGTMAKAARQLGVSQPAVSEAIATLEHALKVRLLDRGPRGVSANAYGAVLLDAGRAAFDELRRGIGRIELLSDPDAGDLRIAAPESVSAGILVPAIALMAERYPRVRVFVEPLVLSARPLFPQLENREVDLVITRPTAPLRAAEFTVETLFNDRIRLAVARNGPWARRRNIELTDFVDASWITVPTDDIGGVVLKQAFRDRGLAPPPIAVTTYSIHLRTQLAARARFVAVLPASVLRFNADGLYELPIDLPEPAWPVAIVAMRQRSPNPIAERFVACAREAAGTIGNGSPRAIARGPLTGRRSR